MAGAEYVDLVDQSEREAWRCWLGPETPGFRYDPTLGRRDVYWFRYYYEQWREPDGNEYALSRVFYTTWCREKR